MAQPIPPRQRRQIDDGYLYNGFSQEEMRILFADPNTLNLPNKLLRRKLQNRVSTRKARAQDDALRRSKDDTITFLLCYIGRNNGFIRGSPLNSPTLTPDQLDQFDFQGASFELYPDISPLLPLTDLGDVPNPDDYMPGGQYVGVSRFAHLMQDVAINNGAVENQPNHQNEPDPVVFLPAPPHRFDFRPNPLVFLSGSLHNIALGRDSVPSSSSFDPVQDLVDGSEDEAYTAYAAAPSQSIETQQMGSFQTVFTLNQMQTHATAPASYYFGSNDPQLSCNSTLFRPVYWDHCGTPVDLSKVSLSAVSADQLDADDIYTDVTEAPNAKKRPRQWGDEEIEVNLNYNTELTDTKQAYIANSQNFLVQSDPTPFSPSIVAGIVTQPTCFMANYPLQVTNRVSLPMIFDSGLQFNKPTSTTQPSPPTLLSTIIEPSHSQLMSLEFDSD